MGGIGKKTCSDPYNTSKGIMMGWKERTNELIEKLPIWAKLAVTLGAILLSYEVAIHGAEPLSRAVAIPALRALAGEKEPVNPNYLPLHTQIQLAVEGAEKQGVHVTYERLPDAANVSDFIPAGTLVARCAAGEIIRGGPFSGAYLKEILFSVFADYLPHNLDSRMATYGSGLDIFKIAKVEGSGFARRQTPYEDLQELRQYVDEAVAQNNGQPIPGWYVLEYWLTVNNGNLNESLHDTALSMMAIWGNDTTVKDLGARTADWDKLENINTQYIATHFQDNGNLLGPYQVVAEPYQQMRMMYSEWITAANLDMFSTMEVVGMRQMQDYAAGDSYGAEKVISSEVAAMDLNLTSQYLNSLPRR